MNSAPKSKRQRINHEYMEKENFIVNNQPYKQYAQVPFHTNFNNKCPPTPELGHIDELFNWLDEENTKPNNDYPSMHGVNDVFGFLTPPMIEMNFF